MEPSRCCISSIALVLLKTGIDHSGNQVTVDYSQMATAQKLLLFWRKPAVRPFSTAVSASCSRLHSQTAEMLVGRPRSRSRAAWGAGEGHQAVGTASLDARAQPRLSGGLVLVWVRLALRLAVH